MTSPTIATITIYSQATMAQLPVPNFELQCAMVGILLGALMLLSAFTQRRQR